MASESDPYAQAGDSGAFQSESDALPADSAAPSQGVDHGVDQADPIPTASKIFYGTDVRKVTFGEFWAATNPLDAIASAAINKGLRIRTPTSLDDPAVHSLDAFIVPETQIPPHIMRKFEPLAAELRTIGFATPIYHTIDDVHQKTRQYLATYSHNSLPVVARVHNRLWEFTNPPKDRLFTEFVSAFADGTHIWSISSKPDLLQPSSCTLIRKVKASPLELWDLHAQALGQRLLTQAGVPARNPTEARAIVNKLHDQVREFHLARGVFTPLKAKEQKAADAALVAQEEARRAGSQYPEVMAEISKLQKAKVGWLGTALLLLLSIGLFIGFGLTASSGWPWLLKIIPILLFHETGHYVAMKICGYTNLRMFFIPGFGAAVTGRNYNVEGWKKAVVSLAGPLPGIFVGIVLGLVGMVTKYQWMVDVGAIAVGINGFNLLPVLPLDGGRVLQTTLFSRHHVLDIVFQIVTALAVVVGLTMLGSKIGIYIAASMVLGLGGSIRIGKAAAALRREKFVPASHDNQTISVEAADRIITQLKAGEKKPSHSIICAQQTLSVFETLNTKPPSWGATIGLLTLHGVAFVAALIFTIVFVSQMRGSGGGFLRAAMNQPQHSITAASVQGASALPDAAMGAAATKLEEIKPAVPMDAVVATLKNEKEAEKEYQDILGKLQPGQTVTRLGETILVTLPRTDVAGQSFWIDELSKKDELAFISGEKMEAHFRIMFVAPSGEEAEKIVDEFRGISQGGRPEQYLVPWAMPPARTLTPEQRKIRLTWAAMAASDFYNDPRLEELEKRVGAAARRGQDTKAMHKERSQIWKELQTKHYETIVNDASGKYDKEFALEYQAIMTKEGEDKAWEVVREKLGGRMGTALPPPPPLPAGTKPRMVDGEEYMPEPKYPPGVVEAANPLGIRNGYATREGLLVSVNYVIFIDPLRAMPAFVRWVEQEKKCTSIKYEVLGSEKYEEPEPEAAPADAGNVGEKK